jgi:CheY-like chemotaxis protein
MAAMVAFDLAALDYQLPDMNGALLAMHIRLVKPDVPLLLFSAIVSLPAEERCLVDEFVSKGESIDLLLYKVRRLLELRQDDGCSRFDKVDVGCRQA